MTEELFRKDAYLRECTATVAGVNDRNGIILDRTIFYPTGGGQPGDSGCLVLGDGREFPIATTVHDRENGTVVHVPQSTENLVCAGDTITCRIDWERRYGHMRIHTCLHLLCSLIDYPVTGGQISEGAGRLDFDIPQAVLDKAELTAQLNQLVEKSAGVSDKWITDEELEAQPELVRTMAVKPPKGSGRVRLVEIDNCDLQPCGGTHVRSTGEIGEVIVAKIEKKGAHNRRVRIRLV